MPGAAGIPFLRNSSRPADVGTVIGPVSGVGQTPQTIQEGQSDFGILPTTIDEHVLSASQVEMGQSRSVQPSHHLSQSLEKLRTALDATRRDSQLVGIDPLDRQRVGVDAAGQTRNARHRPEPAVCPALPGDLKPPGEADPPRLARKVLDDELPVAEIENQQIRLGRPPLLQDANPLAPEIGASRRIGRRAVTIVAGIEGCYLGGVRWGQQQ